MKNRPIDLEIEDNELILTEYLAVQEDGPVKEREAKWLAGGEDEEGDDTFEWIDDLEKQDEKKAKNETYFIFANEMRRPMKKGTQAWNCYGNRTNEYLLVNYGFCFENNLYSSYSFNVKLNV